jgi:hypothetical protein
MTTHSRWIILAALGIGIAIGYVAALSRTEEVVARAETPPKPIAKSPVRKNAQPNIVFVMADNLGYGEPGCYGGGILRGAPTPRIDKLATQGIRLLNYSVESQCTPSRSALLTGRFALRSGTTRVNRGGGPYGLTQWEITLAELLSVPGTAFRTRRRSVRGPRRPGSIRKSRRCHTSSKARKATRRVNWRSTT